MDLGTNKTHLRRTPWGNFPDVAIHAPELFVKKHPLYAPAKLGNAVAAEQLVLESTTLSTLDNIITIMDSRKPQLLAVHALETKGMNVIPRVLASILARMLGLPISNRVVQINRVTHTGADGYHRLAFPALFKGEVEPDNYFLVDDFVGQGGTLANLKGFVESQGGRVIGAAVLTGKAYSAKLSLTEETLQSLRSKHGNELEAWWTTAFGYSFERLTESEARYLARVDDADTLSDRLAAARRKGDRRELG